jgi:predicted  nucleic acid-binding Zn-ribbon protein
MSGMAGGGVGGRNVSPTELRAPFAPPVPSVLDAKRKVGAGNLNTALDKLFATYTSRSTLAMQSQKKRHLIMKAQAQIIEQLMDERAQLRRMLDDAVQLHPLTDSEALQRTKEGLNRQLKELMEAANVLAEEKEGLAAALSTQATDNERLLNDLVNEESTFHHKMKAMAVKVEELVKENSEVHAAPIVCARWLAHALSLSFVTCASGLQP